MSTSSSLPFISATNPKSKDISALLTDREFAYFIPPQTPDEKGFIPACAIERVQGYHMMSGSGEGSAPWYFGKTEQEAEDTCTAKNLQRGISADRAQQIVLSTMSAF